MTMVLEAWDWFRFADQYGEKLAAARTGLQERKGYKREKRWMEDAVELVEEQKTAARELAEKLRNLPEMAAAREEHAGEQVGPFVDGLEKLLAGITFHFGSRAPVIEALFPHQKLAALRKANLDAVREFWTELDRRLKSSYVDRIFAQDDYAFAREVVEQVRAAYAAISSVAEPPEMPEEERTLIAERAIAAAKQLELVIAQSRLLAEAALASFEGAYAEAGLSGKPKKRAAKPAESESESDVPAAAVEPEPQPEEAPRRKRRAEVAAAPAKVEVEVEVLAEAKTPKKARTKKSAAASDEDRAR